MPHDKILAFHQGQDSNFWIGADHGGGVNRLKISGETRATRLTGLIDAAPRVIFEDHTRALWIGTKLKGLNIVRQGQVAAYTTSDGLAGNDVWVIIEDHAENVWVGTDGGLMRWKDGKFVTFTTRDGLAYNTVDALYEDADQTLWIGTRGGGLTRLKNGKFTSYTTKQGLFSDEIYEILEDDFGYFWMSCRSGIFRVRKKDFDDLDAHKSKSIASFSFGKADGLASVQCNGVSKPSGCKGKNGRLWFATIRGVVRVETALENNQVVPQVVIEEAILDRQNRREVSYELSAGSLREPFRVPPGRGELEVHYTALSLRAPEKNRFKYMLEGLDTDWIDAGNRREAVYNNIGPGSYTFRVKACNNDGVWNETGASLSIVFLPHFWQTWWFKVAVPMVFGLLLWAWYHLRVSRLRAIERLRVQIAADLHDDVGSRLTKIAMVTELVERQTPDADQAKPQIQKIASTTREVIQAMDEIVWTINPKNDTLDNLINYIFQYAQEYFQNTGVRCRLDLPARIPDLPLSTEERHNLFMAFKEALNNVLKHAGATEVRVGLLLRGDKVVISVVDNGCGFTPNGSHGSGNGLINMRNRLEQIGGLMTFESTPGTGTKVEMEAPLK
jgi:signal transduction histidine kinase